MNLGNNFGTLIKTCLSETDCSPLNSEHRYKPIPPCFVTYNVSWATKQWMITRPCIYIGMALRRWCRRKFYSIFLPHLKIWCYLQNGLTRPLCKLVTVNRPKITAAVSKNSPAVVVSKGHPAEGEISSADTTSGPADSLNSSAVGVIGPAPMVNIAAAAIIPALEVCAGTNRPNITT